MMVTDVTKASRALAVLPFTVLTLSASLFSAVFAASPAFSGELVRMKNQTLALPAVQRPQSGPFNTTTARFYPSYDKTYYIIQFDGAARVEWMHGLAAKGVILGSYLPDDAFVAKIDSARAWLAVNAQEHIRAVTEFSSDLRLSQEFEPSSVFNRDQLINVNLKLTSAAELKPVLQSAKGDGIEFRIVSVDDDMLMIQTLRPTVEKIAAIEGVEWVEPAKELKTFDLEEDVTMGTAPDSSLSKVTDYSDLTGYESGTKLMDFAPAYARGLHGEGQIIGIADTGVDRGSLTDLLDDFKGQIPKAYALGYWTRTWQDPQGHGTHTAGSIVGSGASSNGKLRGGAYGAKLIPQGLWSDMLNNLSMIPDFDKIFGSVRRTDDVHIHSDSWGSPRDPGAYDSNAAMLDAIAFKYPDLLIVFAAGNSGVDLNRDGHVDDGSVSTPSTAKNCLTVGASKNLVSVGGIQKPMKELRDGGKKWGVEPIASSKLSDNANGIAAFSSTGPTTDGRIKPDIVAPGTNIISTRSQQEDASALWGAYNQYYAYAGGTSMATPLTAGAAAVIRQGLQQIGFSNPSAAAMKAVMLHSATDLYPGQFGRGPGQEFKTTRPNNHEGYGRVDVGAAIALTAKQIIDDTHGLKTGDVHHYKIAVAAGDKIVATMVYTDAPASAGTAQALVNDLDLKIVDSAGKPHFPNHLKRPDFLNNVELVEFTAEKSGTFDVQVKGRNVPKGMGGTDAQPYALVLSAAPSLVLAEVE